MCLNIELLKKFLSDNDHYEKYYTRDHYGKIITAQISEVTLEYSDLKGIIILRHINRDAT